MAGQHEPHGGHHHHDHTAGATTRMLAIALALTGGFLIVQVIGAFRFNSLALLSDAGHMLTDVAALTIALMAVRIGLRPADDRRTFGYRRIEILAATFNALMLFAIAIYILIETMDRLRHPEEVESLGMLAVAVGGLIVNLLAMRVLKAGKDESLNIRAAYLEVWADMLGSVGVIVGALVIRFTGWTFVDPLVAVAIALWVLPRTWILLRQTLNVLLEGVPGGLDLPEIRRAIAGMAGVSGVHDLHVWATATNEVHCTVHVELETPGTGEAVRIAVRDMLADRFAIFHATIQPELELCEDDCPIHP